MRLLIQRGDANEINPRSHAPPYPRPFHNLPQEKEKDGDVIISNASIHSPVNLGACPPIPTIILACQCERNAPYVYRIATGPQASLPYLHQPKIYEQPPRGPRGRGLRPRRGCFRRWCERCREGICLRRRGLSPNTCIMDHPDDSGRRSRIVVLLRSACRRHRKVLPLLLLHALQHPPAKEPSLLPPSSCPPVSTSSTRRKSTPPASQPPRRCNPALSFPNPYRSPIALCNQAQARPAPTNRYPPHRVTCTVRPCVRSSNRSLTSPNTGPHCTGDFVRGGHQRRPLRRRQGRGVIVRLVLESDLGAAVLRVLTGRDSDEGFFERGRGKSDQ